MGSGQNADHVKSSKDENQNFFEAGIWAGKGHQWGVITIEVTDDVGATVDQLGSNYCVEQSNRKAV